MTKRLRNVGIGLLIAAAAQLLMGCDASTGTADFIAGGAPTGGSGGTTAGSGVDTSQFSVGVVPVTGVTSVMHRSDVNEFAYTSPCTISSGSIGTGGTAPVIKCIDEQAEEDLYSQGATLQFNIPPGKCSYLEFMPPYYFRYPVGPGPGMVQYTQGPTGITDTLNSVNGVPTCPFDYSKTASSTGQYGPNCCTGNYTLQVTTITQGPTGNTSTFSSTQAQWGGSDANCLAGPAMDTQEKAQSGYPKWTEYNVGLLGYNGTYTVKAPISNGGNSNIAVANYIGGISSLATPDLNLDSPVVISANVVGLPPAFYPPNGAASPASGVLQSVTPLGAVAEPYFQFDCVDAAYELQARILVQIRSWDLKANVGTATSYSITGGVDPNSGIPYHFWDVWLDIISQGTAWLQGYPKTIK